MKCFSVVTFPPVRKAQTDRPVLHGLNAVAPLLDGAFSRTVLQMSYTGPSLVRVPVCVRRRRSAIAGVVRNAVFYQRIGSPATHGRIRVARRRDRAYVLGRAARRVRAWPHRAPRLPTEHCLDAILSRRQRRHRCCSITAASVLGTRARGDGLPLVEQRRPCGC